MADSLERSPLVLARAWRFSQALAARFFADRCLLHAAALTYSTLLSLVPLLALMFAVLKGLGVQARLEPILLSRLSLSRDVTDQILTYIDRTNVGGLGVIGALALLWALWSLLSGIEDSFNYIWRVTHGRTLLRQLSDYASTVLLTPFLLLAATVLTSSLQVHALLDWFVHTGYGGSAVLLLLRLTPFVINTIALAILYAIMPNRRPHVRSLLVGACVAGCVWQLVQWTYVEFQIGVAQYNAIYGALAQLPLTLVWLSVSWTVVLAGAELAALYEFGADASGTSSTARWLLAVAFLLRAARQFRTPVLPFVTLSQLARTWQIDRARVIEIAEHLCAVGVLAQVGDDGNRYVLSRAPESIALAPLIDGMDDRPVVPGDDAQLHALVLRLGGARREVLSGLTLADLLDTTCAEPAARVTRRGNESPTP
ncbi:MAG: ribonuclease BN-like protein [Deltaproteobacteria bacterium]|nr:ribonuclease BN-like protein [Deltaproteobacteria bacterium]